MVARVLRVSGSARDGSVLDVELDSDVGLLVFTVMTEPLHIDVRGNLGWKPSAEAELQIATAIEAWEAARC